MKPSLANKTVMESYCTTGQFAKRDRTYHKHCGPTAITNLVLTLRPDLANAPAQVFDEVAALGRRLLAYWNVGAGKWLGGTSDGLAGLYLRQVLNHFDCGNVKVRFGGPATEDRVRAALARGNIVYLEMHFHPKYRNHHLLLYGYGWQGFRSADGWRKEPVYLSARDLRRCTFFSVGPVAAEQNDKKE